MPTIGMQMPQLYLRGKLVNETIRNLSEDERKIVESTVIDLTDDPLLQPTRYQFKNALKFTIKGDYASDDATADQELPGTTAHWLIEQCEQVFGPVDIQPKIG